MTVRLWYFDMTGLGEPVRLMLAYGNIKFEDKRVAKEEWSEMKKNMRWNHLPKLEIEDRELFQSKTICRYLAKKLNLCGKNEWDATYCDMMVDMLDDFRKKIVSVYYTLDSDERATKMATLKTTVVPEEFEKFEQHVAENGGFLVSSKLTWADIIFLAFSDYFSQMLGSDLSANYPKIKSLLSTVRSQPGITKYLKTRPPPPDDMRKLFF